jgi:hypothetical protein
MCLFVAVCYGEEKAISVTTRPTPVPKHWAIVIGVNGYSQRALKYCVEDATSLAETLRKRCGYSEDHVYLMIDGLKDYRDLPTRENILQKVKLVSGLPRKDDTLLLFFSGHGTCIDGKVYLVPIDANVADIKPKNLVSVAELREMCRSSVASRKILILDSCHSGGEKGTEISAMSQSFVTALRSDAEGLVTLASCRESETSIEAPWYGHGLFTYWLNEGLIGRADEEEAGNKDGRVEVSELYQFVYERVRTEAAKREGHSQNPFLYASLSGKFELAAVSPPLASQPTIVGIPTSQSVESKSSSDSVRNEGDCLIVTVTVSAPDELSRIQRARQRTRELFANYMKKMYASEKTKDEWLEFARDNEKLLDAEENSDKLTYTVQFPISEGR